MSLPEHTSPHFTPTDPEAERITDEFEELTQQFGDETVTVIQRFESATTEKAGAGAFEIQIGAFALSDLERGFTPPDVYGNGDRLILLEPGMATTAINEKDQRKLVINIDGRPAVERGTNRRINKLAGRNIRFIADPLRRPGGRSAN